MTRLLLAILVCFILATGTASAALVAFTDEAAFLAATGPLGFEGFENTPPGFTGTSRVLTGFVLGPLDAGISRLLILNDPAFASEGTQSAGGNVTGVFLAFGTPATALGFTFVDFGNAAVSDSLQLTLTRSSGAVETATTAITSDPFKAFRFFGVISTEPFSSAQIRKSAVDDFIAFDEVYFGQPIPVPEVPAALLIVLGLAAGAGFSRFRQTPPPRL